MIKKALLAQNFHLRTSMYSIGIGLSASPSTMAVALMMAPCRILFRMCSSRSRLCLCMALTWKHQNVTPGTAAQQVQQQRVLTVLVHRGIIRCTLPLRQKRISHLLCRHTIEAYMGHKNVNLVRRRIILRTHRENCRKTVEKA